MIRIKQAAGRVARADRAPVAISPAACPPAVVLL
jgi:hypothetical protein